MNDEDFEKYFRLLKEYFDALKYFEDVSNQRRQDIAIVNIKEILEEIYNKGYEDGEPAKWTIHYPKNMKRG